MSVKSERIVLALLAVSAMWGQEPVRRGAVSPGERGRWALILEEAPLAQRVQQRGELKSPRMMAERSLLESSQNRVAAMAKEKGIQVIGATQTLLNAVYVVAKDEQVADLAQLPGVIGVQKMQRVRRSLNKAVDLVKAPQAWAAMGGAQNAGLGMKIGIIDSGLDNQHPGLRDNSLPAVPGYPKCRESAGECAYATSKIIAVRSYVDRLVYYFPDDTRPDDLTPQDFVGHGTAVAMIAAGNANQSPVGTIQGVAPKAYLGNYKIFGSPGVNDITFTDVIIAALEDAFNDGMDIVTMSLQSPAEWAPNNQGSYCNKPGVQPCDVQAAAVQIAVGLGLNVVVAAGNEGDAGQLVPSLNTITSPGTAPAAITVGATTNSHLVLQKLSVTGAGVPSNLQTVKGLFGTGPRPFQAITAPLKDVSQLQNDGKACQALTNGSLTGSFALVRAGDCSARTKVNNAQAAGATGVVLMRAPGFESLFQVPDLLYTSIPLMQVGSTDGEAIRQFLAQNPNRPVALDPTWTEYDDVKNADLVAYFTSYGPSIGGAAIKPELVAPGTSMMTATQRRDPNSDMFDASGYTSTQGTSFSVPMVAGAAALVKQKHSNWTPAQIKSALVNTTTIENVDDVDRSNGQYFPARVTAIGAGKLDVNAALTASVTVNPAVVSLGVVGSIAPSVGLVFTNPTSSAVTLTLAVQPRDPDSNARVTVTPSSFSLQAGAQLPVTVQLQGSKPAPGSYEGVIRVDGGAATLWIPYLYLVGDGVPYNAIPLKNAVFTGIVDQQLDGGLLFKVVDKYGLPVNAVPVRFSAVQGGGRITQATATTDELGIAEATTTILGPSLGLQVFQAQAGSLPALEFVGDARLRPTVNSNGVVNAASNTVGQGLAPGSYISIYGAGLADAYLAEYTQYLPLSLGGVSVGFDVPGRALSYPGRLHFVSDSQVNVQIPWELQGMTTVNMKVSVGDFSSAIYSVPLNDYSPAPFQYQEASSGRTLAILQDGAYQLISTANPVKRGSTYVMYANGLGPVSNQPASGLPSPSQPVAETKTPVTVTIGNRPAQVSFAGLTPGSIGLYQINVTIDGSTPTGYQPIVISVGGVSSREALVPVQ